MPKKAKELSAVAVKRLTEAGFYAVGGVSGLYLTVNERSGKSWILRTMVGAKRKDIGLGGYPDVSLQDARERAREAKSKVANGIDPVAERKAVQATLIAQQKVGMTFEKAVEEYLASNKLDGLTNVKHRAQWGSTLHTYAVPHLGQMCLADITAKDVKDALDPIWSDKHETATRVRMRIEAVMNWASASGHHVGVNPARWKGNLSEMLPKFKSTEEPHPALAISDIAKWYATLLQREGRAATALAFLTLCVARSGEVRNAIWSEIDLEQTLWVIPAVRMKASRDHRVALSAPAIDILNSLPRFADCDFVFPSPRGKAMSDMTLSAVMKRMHGDEIAKGRAGWMDPKLQKPAVPHGLRSTFRDWVAERTDYPGVRPSPQGR